MFVKGKKLFFSMRKLLQLLVLIGLPFMALAQGPPLVDSMKARLAAPNSSDDEKFEAAAYLCRVMMNFNPAQGDFYGQRLIEVAEVSRDRVKMVNALLINGERYSYLAGRRDNIDKAIDYYTRGLQLARDNKIDTLIIKSYLLLSEVSRNIPDFDKALNYCNQASAYATLQKNDSITARVQLESGSVYLGRNEKIFALENLLSAARIADDLKSVVLRRMGYNKLSGFYMVIKNHPKAIDYQVRAIELLPQLKTGQAPYLKVQELNRTGDIYSEMKDFKMASFYYEKALTLADSIHYEPIKAMSYRSIVNNYLSADQPQQALDYFNAHPQLKEFLKRVNFSHFTDLSYGYIYTKLGKYDSAKYYYGQVGDFFEKDVNLANKYNYYFQLGMLYQKTNETTKAIDYYLKAKVLADQIGNLELMNEIVSQLDTAYQQSGNYKEAMAYATLSSNYKDSLDKLGKENDILKVVEKDIRDREIKLAQERAEAKRRKNNIQYVAITIGIVLLFITLVVLGMFKVSQGLIKAIGFFVFLMLFEFIFLVFKKNIYSITHGEPWKDLLFMIALAALLVPLHHWMEHKVLHYLTSHNRLTAAGHHIKKKFFRRTSDNS